MSEEKKEGEGGKAPDHAKELNEFKTKYAELETKFNELSGKKVSDDKDLNEKAKLLRDQNATDKNKQADLEKAITFSVTAKDWVKQNESLLPKEITEILAAADKDSFDSPVHKSNAIKAGIVKEFFSLQANMDLLTASHKNAVADYLKLTNTGREEKAPHVFENIFEPALEMMRRVKKAEDVGRTKNGFGNPNDADNAYKQKMIAVSKKHYLQEKN